ncbi:MAG: 3-deoxy-D-manno-octulosonic acid transferase [Deferribacteraceae bacterium]|nr:3-deoxy-D-manno-octulosonic acid transferase [Deferribacteraceae bacterium]
MPKRKQGKQCSIWIHCASVGEVRSIAPLIAWLRKAYPERAILISTFTETGYSTATKVLKPDVQFLIPLENPPAINWLIKEHDVRLLIITETELWPQLIRSAAKRIPLLLLNGRISDKTFANYKRFSFITSRALARFKYIYAKSEGDAIRFKSIGGRLVESGGNIKYRHEASALNEALATRFNGKRLALAASTHFPEEELFFSCARSFKSHYDKVLLAPRHIKRSQEILAIADGMGLSVGLYTKNDFDKDIIIIDTFGLLESLYQLSERIFIGGSLANVGGHNVFEALQYNKPICTGPHIQNFNDIIPLGVEHNIITIVNDKAELLRYFEEDEPNANANFQAFFQALKKEQEHYEHSIMASIKAVML